MIFGLTGRNCSGKGTVAEYFQARGFGYYSLSDVIRQVLVEQGKPESRDNLIAAGNTLRRDGGPGVLGVRILALLESGNDYVVDSIRNPAEVVALRAREDFVLLEVRAPERLRYDRLVDRGRVGDATSFDEFQRQERAELQSADSAAQQLDATAACADHVVINAESLDDLHAQLRELVVRLSG
jgi:dephospho-CoA kinase